MNGDDALKGTASPPPALRPGATIAVVAPAGPVNHARLRAGLALIPRDYNIALAPTLQTAAPREPHEGAALSHGEGSLAPPAVLPRYLASHDAQRAADFNAALRNPDVRAIFVARGGYGCSRILPALDGAALRADPKPIVGFSDATALLAWAWHHGVRGIHGPVTQQFADVRIADIEALFQLLTNPAPSPRIWDLAAPAPTPPTRQLLAPLFGGNLALIAHLAASPWSVPVGHAILAFEDVGEKPYAIDRYLSQLDLARDATKPLAWVAGEFVRCMEPLPAPGATDDPREALAVVAERAAHANIPCWQGAPFGHGQRNAPWSFGGRVALRHNELEFLDAAVAG